MVGIFWLFNCVEFTAVYETLSSQKSLKDEGGTSVLTL